jgi:hypothetical protein
MSFGPVTVYPGVIASAASTAAFDLTKSYRKIWADIPCFSTNIDITVYGSADGSTYRVVQERVPNTTSVQYQTLTIASAANNKVVPLDVGLRYVRLVGGVTVNDGGTINLICSD